MYNLSYYYFYFRFDNISSNVKYTFVYFARVIIFLLSFPRNFVHGVKSERQATSPSPTFAPQIFKVPSANFRMLDYAYMFAGAT